MYKIVKVNFPFFLPYQVFFILGGILQLFYTKVELFSFINGNYHSAADYFFKYMTHVGDGLFYILVVVLLALVSYRKAAIALSCYITSSLVAQVLKKVIFTDELRPKAFFENSSYVLHMVEGVTLHSHNSFPSGHATSAFSLFCLLSIFSRNKSLGYLWFCLALIASYSRVYLSQHFFGDIYVGSIIGVVLTLVTFRALDLFFRKNSRSWHSKGLLQYEHN
ncbi:phosphatase PAP2 family protein [Rhodocytophaga aerolata]|uniref:Phosphatase PAP2 family protein n=1 Tax=Rhodocytophaga aerolata TaxID=455078 RepID=A0ABT8R6E8_9BACT|nr:phosphatase PAP2 family protein [Rhodocytophaga aerolata]MDO1447674.1 phosphatase PAP2 family protein [Rhodocytophaga aerolata]